MPEAAYTQRVSSRTPSQTFKHVEYVAPPTAPPPPAQLARPFRHFKLPEAYDGEEVEEDSADEEEDGDCCGKKRKRRKKKKKKKKALTTAKNGAIKRNGADVYIRTMKVEIIPTRAQFHELMATFRLVTMVFNWANGAVKLGGLTANHFELREHFWRFQPFPTTSTANGARPKAVATRVISHAIKELADAHASQPPNKPYRIHDRYMFATERSSTATLTLEKSFGGKKATVTFGPVEPVRNRHGDTERPARGRAECTMRIGSNFERVGAFRIRDRAAVIARISAEGDHLKENAKIQWNKRTNKFYLLYSYTVPKLVDPDPDFAHKRIVAMDPGCAPFQAEYSPTTGNYGELLAGTRVDLRRRCLAIDALQSRIARHRGGVTTSLDRMQDLPPAQRTLRRQATRRRMQKKLRRMHDRRHNWMAAAHYDAINHVFRRFDVVIQPVLETRRLTQATAARFGHGLARRLYSWSHYLFRQRLKSASVRYAGRHVLESTEPGTSRTCTHCGFFKADLRLGDKVYHCPRCHISVDRQTAGARNNFLAAYGIAVDVGWDGVGG